MTVQNPSSSNSPFVTSTLAVDNATSPGFIRGFSLTGAGPTPTFNWTLPNLSHNSQTLFISERLASGPRIIYIVGLPNGATSHTLPSPLPGFGTLAEGTHYWVNINLNYNRADGSLLSRSRSIFEFLVQTSAPADPVFLPFTASDGVFHFDIPGVGSQMIFIDPSVAIGYDYATGAGDPNFASVMLPAVGDGIYRLFLWNGAAWAFDRLLTAGVEHVFSAGGVDRFRILSIEPSAQLDPNNPVAFITGLTFSGSGDFTGTMTPIAVPSIDDSCPCTLAWMNHGTYVACVAHFTEELLSGGLLTEAEKDAIMSNAARSICGRKTR